MSYLIRKKLVDNIVLLIISFFSIEYVSFCSTIGVEATYWGKPSLTLSDRFCSGVNGTYSVFNIDIMKFILSNNLPEIDKKNALMYGFYQLTIVDKYEFWNNDHFKGKRLPKPNFIEKTL